MATPVGEPATGFSYSIAMNISKASVYFMNVFMVIMEAGRFFEPDKSENGN